MGCCSGIAKMLLFIINFCVWVVGVVLIGVGAWIMIDSDKYSYLFGSDDTLTIVSGIIIGCGCFLFFIGFAACCGAMKEIVCLLKIYFALILLVVIVEVVAAILAFVFQDDLIDGLEDSINTVIDTEYGEGDLATESIDALQKDFKCCGGAGVTDWAGSLWAGDNPGLAAPASCCIDTKETDCNKGIPGVPATPAKMNIGGCVDSFAEWLEDNYVIVGAVCLGLLGFEILAMVFSCCLIKNIEEEKYA